MENGQDTLGGIQDILNASGGQVFIRAAVQAGQHAVWHLDATLGLPSGSPGWKPGFWEYEEACFIAAPVSARGLASALDPGDAQVLPLGGFDLTLPVLSWQVSWQHKPSRARYDSVLLPWPTKIFQAHIPGGSSGQQYPHGFLIGDDCPSFPSYDAAFRAFFYGNYSRTSGSSLPSSFATVRVIDDRAWFDRVRVTAASLDIQIGGRAAAGTRVELTR